VQPKVVGNHLIDARNGHVWVPHGAWRKLIDRRLRERGIEFDLL